MAYGRAIKIDGIDLYDLGFKALFPYEDDATYTFSANLIQIPNRPGFLKAKDKIEARKMVLDFQFDSYNNTTIDEKLEELNNLFFDIYGQRKPVKIEMRHWRDRYTIGYLDEIVKQTPDNTKSEVQITLISYDPFKYSNKITTQSGQFGSTNITWGSTTVTFNDPYTFGYTVSSDTEPTIIEVPGGNVVSYPKITVKGSADKLVLYNNHKKIDFGGFTNATIETTRFISYVNGKESFINAVNFALTPGNNRVFVTGTNIDDYPGMTFAIKNNSGTFTVSDFMAFKIEDSNHSSLEFSNSSNSQHLVVSDATYLNTYKLTSEDFKINNIILHH